jgi:hypothetical protein
VCIFSSRFIIVVPECCPPAEAHGRGSPEGFHLVVVVIVVVVVVDAAVVVFVVVVAVVVVVVLDAAVLTKQD